MVSEPTTILLRVHPTDSGPTKGKDKHIVMFWTFLFHTFTTQKETWFLWMNKKKCCQFMDQKNWCLHFFVVLFIFMLFFYFPICKARWGKDLFHDNTRKKRELATSPRQYIPYTKAPYWRKYYINKKKTFHEVQLKLMWLEVRKVKKWFVV